MKWAAPIQGCLNKYLVFWPSGHYSQCNVSVSVYLFASNIGIVSQCNISAYNVLLAKFKSKHRYLWPCHLFPIIKIFTNWVSRQMRHINYQLIIDAFIFHLINKYLSIAVTYWPSNCCEIHIDSFCYYRTLMPYIYLKG